MNIQDLLENSEEVLNELIEHHENLKTKERTHIHARMRVSGSNHVCPRCEAKAHFLAGTAYCMDCNWDSLTDSCKEYSA